MAESHRVAEQVVAELDAQVPDPEARARIVFSILRTKAPDLSEWDLVCFSANYLGYISQELKFLEDDAKRLCRLVYTAHYFDTHTNVSTGLKDNAKVDKRDPAQPESRTGSGNGAGARTAFRSGFTVEGGGFE